MNELKLSVNGNCLAVTEDTVSTQGSVNFDECSFTFNEEWDGFTKTAVFSTDNDDCYKVSVENNSCTIPSVCMEKEGIIRIAVYGIKDEETIITTNSVAHRVSEGIGEVTEWIEEDFSLAQNAINELAAEFNEFRFNTTRYLGIVSSQLTSLGNEVDEFSVSKPDWYIPEAVEDATSCPITTAGNTYDDFLAFKLDKLVEDFPDYVSKNSIGTDHAGDYQVYAYTFEPEKYNKTVMITSYTHGTDRVAFLSLNYLLDYLCRGDDEILRYIKNNIKLQVIPVVNPYGLSNVKTNNV
ncbi:MAG: hypothetical protein KBT46_09075, partial [Ruminococcus sp.]|nr:hypothetical protein [Candidatus Copronaster equi]